MIDSEYESPRHNTGPLGLAGWLLHVVRLTDQQTPTHSPRWVSHSPLWFMMHLKPMKGIVDVIILWWSGRSIKCTWRGEQIKVDSKVSQLTQVVDHSHMKRLNLLYCWGLDSPTMINGGKPQRITMDISYYVVPLTWIYGVGQFSTVHRKDHWKSFHKNCSKALKGAVCWFKILSLYSMDGGKEF